MRYLMQARSSDDGQMYRWMTNEPDFAGAGFPGPGTAEEPAVVAQSGESGGGGETPGLPDVLAVSTSAAGRTITSLGAPELPSDAARLADVEALTADSISFDPEDSGLVSDNVGDGLREVAGKVGSPSPATVDIQGDLGAYNNPRVISLADWQGYDPTLTMLVLKAPGYYAMPAFEDLPIGSKIRCVGWYNATCHVGCKLRVGFKGDGGYFASNQNIATGWQASDWIGITSSAMRGSNHSGMDKSYAEFELTAGSGVSSMDGLWYLRNQFGQLSIRLGGTLSYLSGYALERIHNGVTGYSVPYFSNGNSLSALASTPGVLFRRNLSSALSFGLLPTVCIENGAVTTTKLASIDAGTILGNTSSASSSPTAIKVTDAVCDFKSPDSAFSLAVAPTHRVVDTVDASETLSLAVPLTSDSVTRVVWYLTRKTGGKRETATWFCAVVSDGAEPVVVDENYKISGGDWTDAAVVSFAVVGSTVECRLLNDTADDGHVYSITASPSTEVFL